MYLILLLCLLVCVSGDKSQRLAPIDHVVWTYIVRVCRGSTVTITCGEIPTISQFKFGFIHDDNIHRISLEQSKVYSHYSHPSFISLVKAENNFTVVDVNGVGWSSSNPRTIRLVNFQYVNHGVYRCYVEFCQGHMRDYSVYVQPKLGECNDTTDLKMWPVAVCGEPECKVQYNTWIYISIGLIAIIMLIPRII